jgi:hypothetical protein
VSHADAERRIALSKIVRALDIIAEYSIPRPSKVEDGLRNDEKLRTMTEGYDTLDREAVTL